MPNNRLREAFIQSVVQRIRFKPARNAVMRELEDHLQEHTKAFIEEGLSPGEAEEKTVACMGDPAAVGADLDRVHRPRIQWSLILPVLMLSFLGVAVLLNAELINPHLNTSPDLVKSIAVFLAGGLLAFCLYRLDYTKLKNHPWVLYFASLGILLATLLLGSPVNGVKVIQLPSIGSLKPDHLCSLLFVLAFLGFILKYQSQGLIGLVKMGLISAFSLLALLMFPSFSAMLITLLTYLLLLTTAIIKKQFGAQRWPLLLLMYGTLLLVSLLLLLSIDGYRLERLSSLLGSTDAIKSYPQYVISNLLQEARPIGASGYIASEGFSALPGSGSEYAFTTIIATMGWLAGMAVALIFGFFIEGMGMKALHIRTQYGFYMALGVLGLLGAKFLVSILAGVGLLAGGITGMPFVSYGAADCLIHMASLGLFLSVLRTDGYLQESIQSSSGGRIIKLEDGQLIISLHTRRNK